MSTAVLAESQTLNAEEVEAFCAQMLEAFFASTAQKHAARLEATVTTLLAHTAEAGDDAQIWQPAISILRDALPQIGQASARLPGGTGAVVLDISHVPASAWRVLKLTQSDKSITAIALEVGFSDSSYFSRVFRREVGMAPDAYRRSSGRA